MRTVSKDVHKDSQHRLHDSCKAAPGGGLRGAGGEARGRRGLGQGAVALTSTVATGDAVPAADAAMIVTIAVPPVMTTVAASALSRYQRSSAGANQSANRRAAAAAS